jgi:sugar transferase (PEP-CTERM/EpsH1 system associated)
MRLLFLTSRLPFPPDRGDRLRTYHLLRNLSQFHAITLVSFVTSKIEAQRASELDAFCEDMHLIIRTKVRSQITALANIWRRQPMQALYYRSEKMEHLINSLLESGSYDAIYVHLFRMAPYVSNSPRTYRIVDLTDVVSSEISASLPYRPLLSRFIYQLEQPRIATYERDVASWAEETWLICERDRSKLAESISPANLQVVPNGIDLNRFCRLERRSRNKRLIFVGHLDVFHNIDAALFLLNDLFPRVRDKIPDCTLDIVGPGTGLQLSGLEVDQGIRFRGFVPDLNQVLNEAAVFVAPLRFSAGIQNKVLEAMAAELPVVTTNNVNHGLDARPGIDLLLGDGAGELVNAIVTLLEDEPMRRRVGQAGRNFIEQNFSWKVALQRLAEIERHVMRSG